MLFLYLVLLLDKTIEGINSIMPIVSYRNKHIYGNRLFNYNTIPNMAEIRFGVNKLIVKYDSIIKVQ